MILALAVSVNLRAATVSLGTSRSLISSVTVPTTTAILSLAERFEKNESYFFSPRFLTRRLTDTGGLLILDEMSLLRTVFEKAESVLLDRNLKSCMIVTWDLDDLL